MGVVLCGWASAAGLPAGVVDRFEIARGPLVWERPVEAGSYAEALGEQAGIWGTADGAFEAWAYPFKLAGDLDLEFSVDGGATWAAGSQWARRQVAAPHYAQLVMEGDGVRAVETLFAPRRLAGAAILLDVDSRVDLKVRVGFKVSLAPMLMSAEPPEVTWDADKRLLRAIEKRRGAELLVWSPTAVSHEASGGGRRMVLDVTAETARAGYVPIVLAGSRVGGMNAAETLEAIAGDLKGLFAQARGRVEKVLAQSPTVECPEPLVGEALAWSAVSLDQLRVDNPFVGHGFVSGYAPSGDTTRPGFCWFFDEPTLTSWAFLRAGQAHHVREALSFLLRYQRADGKAVHEVTQSLAYYPDYFEKYRYAYIHSSSGTYLIAACANYYRQTGDIEFVREQWDGLKRMFEWCAAAVDANDGLMRVAPNDWGSSEASFAVNKDTQMEGMWVAALRAMAYMAEALGDGDLAARCGAMARRASESIEGKLWDEQEGAYYWGVDRAERPLRSLVPHHSVSMWMGTLRPDRVVRTLERMARADVRTDWGVRSLAAGDERYSPDGYQTGAVWPVWNAGVIIGDFRAGRVAEGYRNLLSMMRARKVGGLGPMPEVLDGRYCRRLAVGVPHQMFAECAVQNGFYEGLLGLDVDVPGGRITLEPRLPAQWDWLAVRDVPVGEGRLDVRLRRAGGRYVVEAGVRTGRPLEVRVRAMLPAGARVRGVTVDGRRSPWRVETVGARPVVEVELGTAGPHVILQSMRDPENPVAKMESEEGEPGSAGRRIEVAYEGGIDFWVVEAEPAIGAESAGLRIVRAEFDGRAWRFSVEGLPNRTYPVRFTTGERPSRVTGGQVVEGDAKTVTVALRSPADAKPGFGRFVQWQATVEWDAVSRQSSVDSR